MKKYVFFFLIFFIYFFNLGKNAVFIPNEAFYADSALNMYKTHQFLIPIYNIEPRLEKPPLTYWAITLAFYLFGINEFALRFFSALSGFLSSILVYSLGKKLYSEEVGFFGAISLAMALEFISNSRYASPEIIFTFLMLCSIYFLYSYLESSKMRDIFLSSLFAGLTVLTKGPVGSLEIGMIFFFYLLYNFPQKLKDIKLYLAFLMSLLIGGSWYFLVLESPYKDLLIYKFYVENIKRINSLESDPWYFYLKDTLVSFLPFSLFLYPGIFYTLRHFKKYSFINIWAVSIVLVFSLVKMKLPTYIFSAYPAFSLIVGAFVSSKDILKKLFYAVFFVSFIIYFVLVVFVMSYVESFRPYKQIGKILRDQKDNIYELGLFHQNLPFYARKPVLKTKDPYQRGILIGPKNEVKLCKDLLWQGYIYNGSESRFFVFLRDILEFDKAKQKGMWQTYVICKN